MLKRPALLFAFFICTSLAQSQSRIMDSVRTLMNTTKDEHSKLRQIKLMAYYHSVLSNLDSSIYFSEQGLELATKLHSKKDLADIYGSVGLVYTDKGKQPKALELFLKSIRIYEEIGDKKGIADNYVRMGALFDELQDHDKALKNYFTALATYKELKDVERVSMVTGNIGNVYYSKKNFRKAMELYLEAIKIDEELQNNVNLQYSLGYIAMASAELSKEDPAKKDSLNKVSVSYYKKALDLAERMHTPQLIINWVGNLGIKYAEMKNYKEAEKALTRAVNLADSFNLPQEKIQFLGGISELYYQMGDYKRSIDYYKKFTREKDSMFTIEKNNELTKHEMNYEFNKKMEAVKTEQEKKEADAAARARFQKLIIIAAIVVLVITFAALLIILKTLRTTREQKAVIEEQKHVVDRKQEEIISSINYARKIQQSLLTSESYIQRSLNRFLKK